MTLYLDASALLKRYVREPGTESVDGLLLSDRYWVSALHTYPEVAINVARRLSGPSVAAALELLEHDWSNVAVVGIDDFLCRRAATIGAEHRLRTSDAIHIAAAERAGGGEELRFVTFDVRQADAVRALGWPVDGV